MIAARFLSRNDGAIYGYIIVNHGDPKICAAVSALSINCANSIERFTQARVVAENKNGRLAVTLPEVQEGADEAACELLLNSLLLGLKSIEAEHPAEIKVHTS